MDSDGPVKVGLGGTHLDGNGNSLDHFSGTIGGNVASHDLVGLGVDNDLHHGKHFALGEGVGHGTESRLENGDVAVLLGGFFLRVSDGPDFGRRKDGRRDEFVVARTVHSPKDSVGEGVALHERDGSQSDAVRHVTDRVDTLDVGSGIIIDGDEGILGFDSGALQVERIDLALSAGRVQDLVALDALAVSGDHRERSVRVLDDFGGIRVELNVNVGVAFHLFVEVGAHVVVESAQEHIAAVHERHVRSEAVHDLCEFESDKASSNDDHALGLFVQVKDFVGGDGVFDARNVGLEGPSTDGNENVLGGHRLGAASRQRNLHRVLSIEFSESLDSFDAGVSENELGVDVVQAGDFLVFGLHKFVPREDSGGGFVPSVSGHFSDRSWVSRGKDHELLGDASDVDAGSSDGTVVGRSVLVLALQ
mmetsp:Transcript_3987/g.9612  ORF Transcript_3987/g.9612 Transcript_3987/m.9612 type:complete len:420 (+) Transcript_3987:119-1378(+)